MVLSSARDNETDPGDMVWQGVRSLIDYYIDTSSGDVQVYVLYTADARTPAAWLITEFRARGHRAVPVAMLAMRDDGFEDRVLDALPDPDKCDKQMVILTVERDTLSHGKRLRRILKAYDGERLAVFRLISASADLFRHAFNVSPQELTSINAGMLNQLMPASGIRLTSSSGTDLSISLDSERYRWVSNRGAWREGNFVILPPGEVSTFPASINGTLVADGAFNVSSLTSLDARLADHPVRIEIEDSCLKDYSCDNVSVMKLIGGCLEYENFRRVGELGFGTNVGIKQFIPMNSHINERHPGLHIGFGGHGQLLDVVPYICKMHFDLITSDSQIELGEGGVIQSADLASMTGQHPPFQRGLHDQDLDGLEGDCCGLQFS
jgi:hypothetical protein